MNEEAIQQILDQSLGDPSLYFQIMQQNPYLYVFVNRQAETQLDYDNLAQTLWTTIAYLNLPDVQYLALYSRIHGETEPEWETCFEITPMASTEYGESNEQPATLIQADETEEDNNNNLSSPVMAELTVNPATEAVETEQSGEQPTPLQPIAAELASSAEGREGGLSSNPIMADAALPIETDSEGEASDRAPTPVHHELAQLSQSNPHPQINTAQSASSPPASASTTLKTEAKQQTEEKQESSVDLSSYCFIRDKARLTEASSPSKELALSLLLFHKLPDRAKLQVLPNLGKLMKNPKLATGQNVPKAIQYWFQSIPRSNQDDLAQYAFWLSRYCAYPDRTFDEIHQALGVEIAQPDSVPESPVSTGSDPGSIRQVQPTGESSTAQATEVDTPIPEGDQSLPIQTPTSPATATESLQEAEPIDLSHYCFIRNKLLLTSELKGPSKKVAEAIVFFHQLSADQKQSVLPTLEQLFKSSAAINLQEHPEDIQMWLHDLAQIESEDLRKAGIWFSRYCFNPEKTLTEVNVILDAEAAKEAAQKAAAEEEAQAQANQDAAGEGTYSYVAPTHHEYPASTSSYDSPQSATPEKQPPPKWKKFLPIGWVAALVLFIMLGVSSAGSPQQNFAICKDSTGAQSYCQLAAQMVGEEYLTYASSEYMSVGNAPISAELVAESQQLCADEANWNANVYDEESWDNGSWDNSEEITLLSSHSEEILPGILVVDGTQNDQDSSSMVRTACVILVSSDPALGGQYIADYYADVIPNTWPGERYESEFEGEIDQLAGLRALGIYGFLINFGANTLFTAIGLFIASMMGLGVRVYSLDALYMGAFLLGIVETLFSFLPVVGLFGGLALETLALGITSGFVKDFDVDWSAGYGVVAFGALVVIVTRLILHLLLFAFIFSLAFS